jgi:hypothetical protein
MNQEKKNVAAMSSPKKNCSVVRFYVQIRLECKKIEDSACKEIKLESLGAKDSIH